MHAIRCEVCGVRINKTSSLKNLVIYCGPCYQDLHTDYLEDFDKPKYKYSAYEDKEIESAYTNLFGLND